MKVLFTAPPCFHYRPNGTFLDLTIPTTALYGLAAVLEEKGFPTDVLDPFDYYQRFQRPGRFEELLRHYDVLCLSTNSITWPTALSMIRRAARGSRCRIVVGGVHATYCDEYVARAAMVDAVVRGEGERTLPLLLTTLQEGGSLDAVPGVTYRAGREVRRSPDAEALTEAELSVQPLPLWDRMPAGLYSFVPLELSRGCRFACAFCSIVHKHNWRTYSWEAIRKRIDQALAERRRFKFPALFFSDDTFTADPARALAIAEYLRAVAPGVEVGLEARAVDLLRPEALKALSLLNVGFIQVGVECGYEEGLRRVKKGVRLSQVEESAERLHSIGITGNAKYSYILGFPWESASDMKRTLLFAMHLGARYGNWVQMNWYITTPGNEVFDELLGRGLVSVGELDRATGNDVGLFFRAHPSVNRGTYDDVRRLARRLSRSYPWVTTIGNVFSDRLSNYVPEGPEGTVMPPELGVYSIDEMVRMRDSHAAPHEEERPA